MSKKGKVQNKSSKWAPPKNYKDFFCASSDYVFRTAHPVGYFFLVILCMFALLLPAILFCIFNWENSVWLIVGAAGGFIFGIGLFNFVAIIINQYLGHWVSIICFTVGSAIMLISWFQM